jgi:hypothetical protein
MSMGCCTVPAVRIIIIILIIIIIMWHERPSQRVAYINFVLAAIGHFLVFAGYTAHKASAAHYMREW